MLAGVRVANVGAAWEIEAHRRRRRQPVDVFAELTAENERLHDEIEWLRAELYEMWTGLPF